jgi:hypothetical protein
VFAQVPRMNGRITFPGNPWPSGHAIEKFEWTGRFDDERRLWFDFHLESEVYDKAGVPAFDGEGDWKAVIVWNNYSQCVLSSTFWRGGLAAFDGEHTGVLAGRAPQSFAELTRRTFVADEVRPGERHSEDRHHSFGIYLLGHDGVADHRIDIDRSARKGTYDIRWTGRIALVYAGSDQLLYSFAADIREAEFGGIEVPTGLSDAQAREFLSQGLRDSEQFQIATRGERRVFVPA